MNYKFIKTDYLDMVSGGDSDLVRELINIFREQAGEMYSEMRSLLTIKNYHALGLLAHKAKSSVAIMGMEDLANMLKLFELQAKEGKNPEQYNTYISRFGSDTESAIIELDDFINNR
jgi:HPt (histidine-containing phosphotransfer) domain-containing protein